MARTESVNILGRFCGLRDLSELNRESLEERFGIGQADVMALFGGSILAGGDILAKAMENGVAKKYVIVGGEGHTTASLRKEFKRLYPDISVDGLSEAVIYNQYLKSEYGLEADYLETESTNCGNNITLLLDLLKREGVGFNSIILSQDATMQRRMDATLRKHVGGDVKIINYATYQAEVKEEGDGLAYKTEAKGMWTIERYIKLLVGEIHRLKDDESGYGPRGKNFIAHVEIPKEVEEAFNDLKEDFSDRI